MCCVLTKNRPRYLFLEKPRFTKLNNCPAPAVSLNCSPLVRANFSSRQSDLRLRSAAPRCGRYSISFFLYRSGGKEVIPREHRTITSTPRRRKKKRRPTLAAFLASPLDSSFLFLPLFLPLIYYHWSFNIYCLYLCILLRRGKGREER